MIERAKELLEELEKRTENGNNKIDSGSRQNDEFVPQQINLADHFIHKELEKIDISQMTPLEALNALAELKEKLKLFSLENKKYIDAD